LKLAAEYLGNEDPLSASTLIPMLKNDFTGILRSLIVNAELDPLVDEGRIYFERLQTACIPSERVILKGAIHGLDSSYPFYINKFYKNDGASLLVNFLKSE
jgi:acetyl esterase/lipase